MNADEIAKGLSPYNPDENAFAAGRIMMQRIQTLMRAGENFAFETTLAGKGHAQLLAQCRKQGYRLTLIFLWLPTVRDALNRVAKRVAAGGHRIPDPVVIRRFSAGLRNLVKVYLPLVDVGLVYDNSDHDGGVLFAEKRGNRPVDIYDPDRWRVLKDGGEWPK